MLRIKKPKKTTLNKKVLVQNVVARLNGNSAGINVLNMEDGQIGVITNWIIPNYIGRVVQRYGDDLVTLGAEREYSWSRLFQSEPSDVCYVRILQPGETLVLLEES